MTEHDRTEDSGRTAPESSPFERFQSLTKRLLHVPKEELDKAVVRDAEKRRTA